jgi:hypothetical protein
MRRSLATFLGLLTLTMAVAACSDQEEASGPRSGPRAIESQPDANEPGGPRISVSVEPARVGPVSLSVTRIRRAPDNDAHPWLEHRLRYANVGTAKLEFDDTRHSAFIPNEAKPVLLVADEGCGYGKPSPSAPIEAGACLTYLDLMTVAPGKTETRDVTIFKGLKGMSKLESGTYSFAKKISFHSGGKRWSKTVRLIYTIS